MSPVFRAFVERMRHLFFWLVQWTWGLPQNLAGLLLALCLRPKWGRFYHAVTVDVTDRPSLSWLGCFTLGVFIFLSGSLPDTVKPMTLVHEYGHTIQSCMMGPLYLPAVGLPSVLWCRRFERKRKSYGERGVLYSSRYPENSANRLGERATGSRAIPW